MLCLYERERDRVSERESERERFFKILQSYRDACYHVGFEKVSAPRAEVICGNMGGRLASFVDKQSITDLKNQIQTTASFTEMWLGKLYRKALIYFLLSDKNVW